MCLCLRKCDAIQVAKSGRLGRGKCVTVSAVEMNSTAKKRFSVFLPPAWHIQFSFSPFNWRNWKPCEMQMRGKVCNDNLPRFTRRFISIHAPCTAEREYCLNLKNVQRWKFSKRKIMNVEARHDERLRSGRQCKCNVENAPLNNFITILGRRLDDIAKSWMGAVCL